MSVPMTRALDREFWSAIDPAVDVCGHPSPSLDLSEDLLRIWPAWAKDTPLLEIGCGWGRLGRQVAKIRPDALVVGTDISEPLMRSARGRLAVVAADDRLPFADAAFGGAWSVLVFQHLEPDATRSYLAELHRVLRPESLVVLQAVDGEGSPGPRSHLWRITEFIDACVAAGFTVRGVTADERIPEWFWATLQR